LWGRSELARKQSLIVLAIAVLIGLIAVYLVNAYLSGAETRQADLRLRKVAVARVPLAFGTPITPDKVQFVDFLAATVPPGSFSSVGQLAPNGNTHVALRPMEAGEPILKSKLSGEGGRATLSAILPPDQRAVSIPISDVSGVAGFVLPGDRVDVFVTRQTGQAAGNETTDVLLQDVRVIAIDQDASDSSNKPSIAKTATLEVSQYDAQKLVLAQSVGSISLALRSVKAQPGQALAGRVSAADLGRGGVVRRVAYAPANYGVTIRRSSPARSQAAPNRRVAAPRRAAPVQVPSTNNVEIVRGTTGSNYEVGDYRGK
jgi:pilus assembly protein CpaB